MHRCCLSVRQQTGLHATRTNSSTWVLPVVGSLFSDEMDGRIFDARSPQTKPPMPNLKRLADAGAVFTTTYSQSPQCVPSRSALMVGLRTDQIEVYDNFVGIAGVNGDPTVSDQHCVSAFGHDACVKFARTQRAPPTFIDRLHTAGYNVSLHGKMHVGGGLDQYGPINAWPFNRGTSTKALREWTRGLGPATNTKGCEQVLILYLHCCCAALNDSCILTRACDNALWSRMQCQNCECRTTSLPPPPATTTRPSTSASHCFALVSCAVPNLVFPSNPKRTVLT